MDSTVRRAPMDIIHPGRASRLQPPHMERKGVLDLSTDQRSHHRALVVGLGDEGRLVIKRINNGSLEQ